MAENCHVEPLIKKPEAYEIQNIQVAFLDIWGMGCPNCAHRVRNNLIVLKGVVDARVDHLTGKAQVSHNPDILSSDDLIAAVVGAAGDTHHEYGAQLAS